MDEAIEIKKGNDAISDENKAEKRKNKKIKKFKQKMAKIDKNKKTGVFKALGLIWSFMGKKEKIMFISIFCFSLISAFCMMFQNVIVLRLHWNADYTAGDYSLWHSNWPLGVWHA